MEIEKRVFFLKYKEHFFMLLCFLCFEMNNNVEAKKKKKYYIHEATTLILKLIIISTQARFICQEGKTVEIFLLKQFFFHSFQLEKHAKICKKNR